jgi:hypothetical protein
VAQTLAQTLQLKPTGWLAVRQIALDDFWSALRFRPAERVGK